MSPEIILGPPGTGKTTALIGEVDRELQSGTPPDRIGYVTFTRRAAEEAISRSTQKFNLTPRQLPYFRTLHSLCFRALGLSSSDVFAGPRLREFADYARIKLTGKLSEDGSLEGYSPGDRCLHLEHLSRVRCATLREQYDAAPDDLPWWETERVALALRTFKAARGLLDFSDMLSEAARSPGCLPRLDVLFVDEVQDQSALMWLVVWALAARARRLVVAGDDDQCHPPGTRILTSEGYVNIEDLSEQRVIQYDRRSQEFQWTGYQVKKAKRRYFGWMFDINGTRCTGNHKILIKWHRKEGFVAYLMRKGDDVRVGWCQLFNVEGTLHLEARRKLEKADALWVLKWFKSKQEASFYEQEVSIKYSISTLMFKQVSGNTLYTQEALDDFFRRTRGQARWCECLRDHRLHKDLPLLSRTGLGRRRSTLFLTHASNVNVVQETCSIPELKHRTLTWVPARVTTERYNGDVYGLDAPPHRYYVANGTIVHNCIFRWAGADVGAFVGLAGTARVLGQSWRVPRAVQKLAQAVIAVIPPGRRRPKFWAPRAEPGETRRALDLGEVDLSGEWHNDVQPVLILARNSYVLADQVTPELRRAGVPYEWGERRAVPEEVLRAVVTWEHLRTGKDTTALEARSCLRLMTPGRGVERAHADLPGVPDDARVTLDSLVLHHGLKTTALWREALDRINHEDAEFVVAVRQKGERLLQRPRVRLSTIHAAKGGEARHVVLFREMARRTHNEMTASALGEEDERRCWYVGVTRAREKLTVVEPRRAEACPWV